MDTHAERETKIGQTAFSPVNGVQEQSTGLFKAIGQENQGKRQESQQRKRPYSKVRVHTGAGQEDRKENLHEERDTKHENAHKHEK